MKSHVPVRGIRCCVQPHPEKHLVPSMVGESFPWEQLRCIFHKRQERTDTPAVRADSPGTHYTPPFCPAPRSPHSGS